MLARGSVALRNKGKASIQVDKFDGGVNTLFSQTRLDKNEAYEAENLQLIEDGVYDKRPGTLAYGGVTFVARPDGFTEYRKSDGTRELIVIADGVAYLVNPLTETKTVISGATFTSGYPVSFIQINNLLYVANGQDDLARYDGTNFSTYTSVATPAWAATPLARGAGLTAGSITYYYRVTAVNGVGETIPAAEQSITVNINRDSWTLATEYIDIDWTASSGATKYIIYFSDTSGYEVKLAETTETTYRDDGTDVPNPYIEPPEDNTTTGPTISTMWISGNRIWGAKDPNNPWRVYFSGTGANLGTFSSAYGGGWIDLEKGGRATTTQPIDFQGTVHVFCKTDDGKGTIWQINLESISIGSESIIVPIPNKIITSIGTADPRSIVYVENDIMFSNTKGVHVLGNEAGILDVLRTNELSSKIRPYWRSLPNTGDRCAYYYDSKVLFSVRNSASLTAPNRTVVYDRERAAWIKDWSIGVSQFGEFTDSSNITHLLGIASNRLIEFSDNFEDDDGTPFTWRYTSPRFSVANSWAEFAKIKKALIRLRSVTGNITFELLGTGKDNTVNTLLTAIVTAENAGSGLGWDIMGNFKLGDTSGLPTALDTSLIRYLIVNKLLRDIQIKVYADEAGSRAVILGLRIEGLVDKTAKPLNWKL